MSKSSVRIRNSMRPLLALLLAGLAAAATAAPTRSALQAVNCVRLGAGTLNPVWMQDIWSYECGSVHPERHQRLWDQLHRLGKSGAKRGSFSNGDVRVAMRAGNARIYLDTYFNGVLIDKAGWRFFSVSRSSELAAELMTTFDGNDFYERLAPTE